MVKILSKSDKAIIAEAVQQAERASHAELACVVAPASDSYQSYIFLSGLLLGSVAALAVWMKTATPYPPLLIIQLGVVYTVSRIPLLRRACLWLVPKRVKHRRAAHRAFEEYLIASRHVPAATPFVLLYVSVAERYAHILPSRSVHEKIQDDNWNEIIRELTASVPSHGLRDACVATVEAMGKLLAQHFPKA